MPRDSVISEVISLVRPYSMVPDEGLEFTIAAALTCVEENYHGVFVECGTWRGGASFATLLAQRRYFGRVRKPIWMFDSFQGLPPADERDGPAALAWQSACESPSYIDNCSIPIADVRRIKEEFGFSEDECIIVPGWFSDTLAECVGNLRETGICLLRVDCDWYEPVSEVLQILSPLVVDDGFFILDDYYFWDGCALATHDFLAKNRLAWRIKSISGFNGAFMRKRNHRAGEP